MMYLGAAQHTNNTAELSALGDAFHWLIHEADDEPVHSNEVKPKTITRYDSEYAAKMATGEWEPQGENKDQIQEVAKVMTQAKRKGQ